MATESVGTTSAGSSLVRSARSHRSIRLRYVDVDDDPDESASISDESSSSEDEDQGTTLSLSRRAALPVIPPAPEDTEWINLTLEGAVPETDKKTLRTFYNTFRLRS